MRSKRANRSFNRPTTSVGLIFADNSVKPTRSANRRLAAEIVSDYRFSSQLARSERWRQDVVQQHSDALFRRGQVDLPEPCDTHGSIQAIGANPDQRNHREQPGSIKQI